MPGMTDKTPSQKKQATKVDIGAGKRKTDWDAIERDYRTGDYTLREMGDKYGITHSAIAQKSKKLGWTQDLAKAVRQATNALLIEQAVTKEINKGTQALTNTVLAAAEVNKQVILSHRSRLTDLADAVDFAKGILIKVSASITEIKDAGTLVQAVNGLSNATKTLIDKEREAYTLNDKTDETKSSEHSVKIKFV